MPDVITTFLGMWLPASLMVCWAAALSEPNRKKRIVLMVRDVVLVFVILFVLFGIIYIDSRQNGGVFWH